MVGKRKKTLEKEALAVRQDNKAELMRLLTKHRMKGKEIDEDFAAILDEQHGLRNDKNERYTVRSLKTQFNRYMKTSAEETRENFEGYQELQKKRLEHLLSLVMDELDPEGTERTEQYVMTHKAFAGYIKEARQLISELSTLTGANAPVEILVAGRIQTEVQLIHEALEQNLPEELYSKVAAVLSHAMGLSTERLGEVERERKQMIDALEAEVVQLLDD